MPGCSLMVTNSICTLAEIAHPCLLSVLWRYNESPAEYDYVSRIFPCFCGEVTSHVTAPLSPPSEYESRQKAGREAGGGDSDAAAEDADFPHKRRNQLLAGLVAAAVMLTFALTNGIVKVGGYVNGAVREGDGVSAAAALVWRSWGIPRHFDKFFSKMYTLISHFSFKFSLWGYHWAWFQLWRYHLDVTSGF